MSLKKFRKLVSLLLSTTVLFTNTVYPSVAFAQEEAIATESADLVANEPLMPESTASAEISDKVTPTPSVTPEVSPNATPSTSPVVDSTPKSSTGSSNLSKEKLPLREDGDFLKETKKQANKDYVEGEVIVKFKEEKIDVKRAFGKIQAHIFEEKFSLEKIGEINASNIQVFKSKKSTEEMVKELKSDPNVEYAQPNYIYKPATINTNDTYKDLLWGLDNTNNHDINAPEAWEISEGSGTIVAVIDSGVAYNHPDLINNMWDGSSCKDENGGPLGGCKSGYDYEDGDKDPAPSTSSHGTHIAGTIAAEKDNGKGIIGVAPGTKIMAIKFNFTTAEAITGINFAEHNGAKIINASWVGSNNDIALKNAVDGFDGLFIAAAGNEGVNNDSSHSYPCDFNSANIICVAATDQNDDLAPFSNYSAISVDVGSPGVDIYSTGFLGEYFTNATPPNFTNTIFTKTSGGWKTGTWGDVGFTPADDKNAQANSSYINNDTGILTLTAPMEESVLGENVLLNFYLYTDTEYYDDGLCYDYLAIETDNNDNNWERKPGVYCGSEAGWATVDLGLATSDMRVRFVWHTDKSITGDQVPVIDDIEITNTHSYEYMSGTSMAAPHVSGLAGLIWSYQPGLTYSQVKDVILNTGDSLPDLDRKTVTGRRINAYEALSSIETPTIIGLSDDTTPTKSKTWNWDSDDATAQFRYLIDQTEDCIPSEAFASIVYSAVKTATQPSGDGTYYLHVQAQSAAGVESVVTTVSAILDNSTPVIYISPLTGSAVNGSSVIEFSDTELVNPQCSINSSQWVSCRSGLTILSEITGFDLLPEGTFTLYVTDTDIAGNTGSGTEAGIIKDTTAPTGLITSPANGLTFASNPPFTASAGDANGVASVKFQHKISSSGSFIDINTDTSAPFEADWAGITLVTNTIYDLSIIITDNAGNTAPVSGVSFTYDIAAPNPPTLTNPTAPIFVNADSYSIEGTAEVGSLVRVYSGSDIVGSQQLSESETNFSVSVSLAQNSVNNFTVSSTDVSSNESSKAVVSEITEDSVAPTIDEYILDNQVISPQVSPGIKDTASIDLKFSEMVDYLISVKNEGGSSVISWSGNATNPYAKIWDGKNTGGSYVADSTYTVEIIITDAANNSTADTNKTIIVDNDPLTLDPIENKNIDENETLTFSASASNAEGDPVSFSLTDAPAGASIDSSTGAFSWTPTEAQGPGSYVLNVNAASGDLSKSEEITITVNEVNTDPVAIAQSVSTNEDVAKIITLSATDVDLPENDLTYSIFSGPTNGTLGVVTGSQVTYTPNLNYNGSDSFTFQVDDSPAILTSTSLIRQLSSTSFGGGDNFLKTFGLSSFTLTSVPTNTATISITVNEVNNAPTITSSAPTVATEDTLYSYSATSEDPDGPGATWSTTPSDTCGGIIDSSTGVYTFTPSGPIPPVSCVLAINVSDGGSPNLSATQTETVTINAVNNKPVAVADSYTTSEDTTLNVVAPGVLANDSDADSPNLSAVLVSGVSNGTLTLNADGSFSYIPAFNYSGTDSFTYKANDGDLDSNTVTVSLTIIPVNDAPSAVADTASVAEDTLLTVAQSTLLANDGDIDGDDLIFDGASNPVNGSVSITDSDVVFTPTANYFGPASFDYTISDGSLTSTATVTVTVNPVNDAPVANAQTVTIEEDNPITITLVGNDVDGDSLVFSITSDPLHGSLGEISGNQVAYNPNADYTGSDSFEFKVNDGLIDSSPALVTITVTPFNDRPVLSPIGNFSINELEELTFTANASDPEGEALTYSLNGNPGGATINSSTGVFNWIPTESQGPGNYTFSVIVSDGVKTDSEEITVTVDEVNQTPIAENISVSTNEDTAKVISLSATDSDLPVQTLTYSIVDDPSHGTVSLSGSEATYTPESNYNGADSFAFKVSDGTLDSNTATVSLTISPVNDAPLAWDDAVSTDEDTTLTIAKSTLLANDSDVDEGDSLNLIDVNSPINGLVVISGSNVVFTPDTNFNGTASFDYTISDDDLTDTATVIVTVNPVNDAPIANDGSASTDEDTSVDVTLSGSDVDGDSLTYSIVDGPSHGALSNVGVDQVTYTPSGDYAGSDSFTFKVNDGTADSNTATVSITTDPINDAPTAMDDTASVDEDAVLTVAKSGLISNDQDVDGDPLTLISVSNPANGTVSIVTDDVVFTPTANYFGPASFDYTISDGSLIDTATVTVTVNPVNDAPIITLTSPNGGQFFAGGSQQEITWAASDVDVGDALIVNLEYLVGTNEPVLITSLLTNSGSYSWSVPEIDSSFVKIVATVFDGAIFASDLSDADFVVDSTPPDGLLSFSSSHVVSTWSNDNTVKVGWAGAGDSTSGVDGYYTEWNNLDSDLTGTLAKEHEVSVTNEISQSLPDGTSHYFHIAAVDKAGNWSTVVHLGPFWVDVTSPSTLSANPASGVYDVAQNIALSSSGSSSIRYSTSEIINNCNDGTAYSGPIALSTSSTIFAIACDAAGNKKTGSFNFIISSTSLIPPSESRGQSSLGSNLILTNDTTLDLVNGVDVASGGDIVIGGVSHSLNNFTSGDLSGEDLSTAQNIGGQTILVEKAVKLESTGDILFTNGDLSDVSVSIPNNTTVLAPSDWNGQISPPKEGSGDGNAPSGFSIGDTVIEVGAPGMVLLFDKAVTILLAGIIGSVGYRAGGSDDWIEISNQCGGSYDAPDSPTFPGECYISDGKDTKILTYHFTSFAKLDTVSPSPSSTPTPTPTSMSSSVSEPTSASEDSSNESPTISQGETISVASEGLSENVLGVKATDEIVQDSEGVQVNKQKETDGKPKLEVLGVEKSDRFPAYLTGLALVLGIIGFLLLKRFRGGAGSL